MEFHKRASTIKDSCELLKTTGRSRMDKLQYTSLSWVSSTTGLASVLSGSSQPVSSGTVVEMQAHSPVCRPDTREVPVAVQRLLWPSRGCRVDLIKDVLRIDNGHNRNVLASKGHASRSLCPIRSKLHFCHIVYSFRKRLIC